MGKFELNSMFIITNPENLNKIELFNSEFEDNNKHTKIMKYSLDLSEMKNYE